MRWPRVPVAACVAALLIQDVARSHGRADVVDLFVLRNKEELVLTTGTRLAVAAADACARQAPALGLALHDLGQYSGPYRAAAGVMFARPDLPAVLAVATGGAAAAAGVRMGDAVVAVNGRPVPAASGLARVETVLATMVQAAATGTVRLTLIRNETERTAVLAPPNGCAVRFQVEPGAALDARTNGWLVDVTTALIDFVQGPDELAAVLAHELGHVILDRGGVRRQGGASRAAELAADRLGVRLAHRAGFRAAAAATFWQRMRDQGGTGPSARHPADGQRVATVEAALRELAAAGDTR